MKTLIVGLGNPILSDDGIGVVVANALQHNLPDNSGVDITELSVGGLALMESMVGYDKVIIIDALMKDSGNPGQIHLFRINDLLKISPTQHINSPHQTNLSTALMLGKQMGLRIPEDITIIAIEAINVSDFSENLSKIVEAAIPSVIDILKTELTKLTQ